MRWSSFRRWKVPLRRLAVALVAVTSVGCVRGSDFVPAYAACQTGGGMGTFSAGAGWRYGKGRHWETEVFFGVIPKHDSRSTKATAALKENYIPWRIGLKVGIEIEPLTASLYLTTVISKRFWVSQPDRYPTGYYRLPTKIRTNIAVGQRLTWRLPERWGVARIFGSLSAYWEIGTCDIYLLSAAGNRVIKPHDWLQLCLGLRFNIGK